MLTPRLGVTGRRDDPDGFVHAVLLGGDVAMLKVGLPGCQAMGLHSLGAVQSYVFGEQVVRPCDCVKQPVFVDFVCLGLQLLAAIGAGTDVDFEGAAERFGCASGALI